MVHLTITNLVATGHIGHNVDLQQIAKLPHIRFDSKIYRCAYVKTPTMHSTVSVFRTCKMISTGTKSESDARHDLQEVSKYYDREKILNMDDAGFKLQNLILVGELEARIDLNKLYGMLGNAMFEPEQFPGIIHYLPNHPNVSILLFQSGKCVVAGIRNTNQIREIKTYLEGIERLK